MAHEFLRMLMTLNAYLELGRSTGIGFSASDRRGSKRTTFASSSYGLDGTANRG